MKENEQHFEQVWHSSEELVSKIHKNTSTEDLIRLITNLLDGYRGLGSSDLQKEIKTSLLGRHMGEIMFLLTAISARDNINVWQSLSEELKLNA
jgi:hypothetical protein